MLRDRLKELDLRITELAEYLQISRPTMYKFIEYYDNKEFNLINKKVLKLFNYINEHSLILKNNVINYILTNLVEVKELNDKEDSNTMSLIKKYIISNPDSSKSKFIKFSVEHENFDQIIKYLVEITPLINKRKLTPEQQALLKPYKQLLDSIKNLKEEN